MTLPCQLKYQTSRTTQATIDHVPPNVQESSSCALLLIFEDNEALTKDDNQGQEPAHASCFTDASCELGLATWKSHCGVEHVSYSCTHKINSSQKFKRKVLPRVIRRMRQFCLVFILSLITAHHCQSLPHWFCLLSRWRREAVRWLTSKSKPEGKRVLAVAAVRHEKCSPSISAQEKTQSDVKGQENPSPAAGDRLHFPGVQASGDQWQSQRDETVTNMLLAGVKVFFQNLLWRCHFLGIVGAEVVLKLGWKQACLWCAEKYFSVVSQLLLFFILFQRH